LAYFFYPPDLAVRALVARFPAPLGAIATSEALRAAVKAPAPPPTATWAAVADLIERFRRRRTSRRPGGQQVHGGAPPIDAAVDAGNEVARRRGLPIAVVDRDRLRGALSIGATPPRTVFVDVSGRPVEVGDLPSLDDARGPCITPVAALGEVATTGATRVTLSILWGTAALAAELDTALREHRDWLVAHGAECEELALAGPADGAVGRALLDDILDDPASDQARRVFADWLDQVGGQAGRRRAAYIRDALAGREELALARQVDRDLALSMDFRPIGWSRGFVRSIHLNRELASCGALADEPVVEVAVGRDLPPTLPRSTRLVWANRLRPLPHPAPDRLLRLVLSGYPEPALWPWLAGLSALEELSVQIFDGSRWQLTGPPALRRLELYGGLLDRAAVAALPVRRLTTLIVWDNRLDDAAWSALPRAPALEVLRLERNPVTTLAPVDRAPLLRALTLRDLPLAAGEAARILALPSLEELEVVRCPAIEGPLLRALDAGARPYVRFSIGT
jgi:uncharacterized protein (TIGR02996 family)